MPEILGVVILKLDSHGVCCPYKSVSACGFYLTSLLILLAFTGCAAGPDFKRPSAPAASGYAPGNPVPKATSSAPVPDGESQRFNPAADIPFDWWTLFQSPQINTLVMRAFKANPSIESAQAAGTGICGSTGGIFLSHGWRQLYTIWKPAFSRVTLNAELNSKLPFKA